MTLEELISAGLDTTEFQLPEISGNFERSFRMSDVVYWIRFWLTERGDYCSWHIDLLDPAKSAIAQGIRLVPNHCLFRRITDPRRPPGILILADSTKSGLEPGLNDLGKRFKLIYATPAAV